MGPPVVPLSLAVSGEKLDEKSQKTDLITVEKREPETRRGKKKKKRKRKKKKETHTVAVCPHSSESALAFPSEGGMPPLI